MAYDDETPRNGHHSGEWGAMDFLKEAVTDIRRKLDHLLTAHGDAREAAAALTARVEHIERRLAEADVRAREFGVGARLSVLGAILSPVAVLVIELLRHHP